MWQKLYFGSVLLFFLLMNALLWRSVLGNQNSALPVPVDSVLRRLLESADDSILEIRHRGVKIGNCHWSASILTSQAPLADPEVPIPEGMVPSISSYNIDFDGTVMLNKLNPLRFKYSLLLDTNQVWRDMELSLALRPSPLEINASEFNSWEVNVRSVAAQKTFLLAVSHGEERNEQTFSLADAEHPEKLVAALTTGGFAERFKALGLPLGTALSPTTLPNLASSDLTWKARASHRKIGHSNVPVYQLEAFLLDTSLVVVCILESGEILRVELPGELVLVNAELLSM